MNFIHRIRDYLTSARLEIKNVNWPTRQQTAQFTVFVIAITAVVAVYLGALDFIFIRAVEWLVL